MWVFRTKVKKETFMVIKRWNLKKCLIEKKPEKSHELPTKWREQNANFYWYVEAIGLSKALKQGQHDFCCLWLQDGPESSNDVACLLNKLRNTQQSSGGPIQVFRSRERA